jgi:hypothetical protein
LDILFIVHHLLCRLTIELAMRPPPALFEFGGALDSLDLLFQYLMKEKCVKLV